MAPSRAAVRLASRYQRLSLSPVVGRAGLLACSSRRQAWPTLRHPFQPATTNTTTTRSLSSTARLANPVEPPDHLDENELKIFKKLRAELDPVSLEVQDISGGCGSMYGLDIVSAKFSGLPVIKQHKLVNQVLAEDIKGWHGVQLKTRAP